MTAAPHSSQSVAGPQTEHTSLRGSLKGTKALDGLGNVIPTKINLCYE